MRPIRRWRQAPHRISGRHVAAFAVVLGLASGLLYFVVEEYQTPGRTRVVHEPWLTVLLVVAVTGIVIALLAVVAWFGERVVKGFRQRGATAGSTPPLSAAERHERDYAARADEFADEVEKIQKEVLLNKFESRSTSGIEAMKRYLHDCHVPGLALLRAIGEARALDTSADMQAVNDTQTPEAVAEVYRAVARRIRGGGNAMSPEATAVLPRVPQRRVLATRDRRGPR